MHPQRFDRFLHRVALPAQVIALVALAAPSLGCDDDGADLDLASTPTRPRSFADAEGQIWRLQWHCDVDTARADRRDGRVDFDVRATADPSVVELHDVDRDRTWTLADVVAPDQLEWTVARDDGAVVGQLILRDVVLLYDAFHVGQLSPPVDPEDCSGTATSSVAL